MTIFEGLGTVTSHSFNFSMVAIFEIIEFLIPFAEALMFFLLFEAFLQRRSGWNAWRYGLGVCMLGGFISVSNYLFLYTLKNSIVIIALAVATAFIFYEGTLYARGTAAFMGILISTASDMILLNLWASALDSSVARFLGMPVKRIVCAMLSKTMGLAICNGIRIKRRMKHSPLSVTFWMMYMVLFGIVAITVCLIFQMTYELNGSGYNNLVMICAFGVLLCTFFALYLYEKQIEQSERLRMQAQYERHLKSQVKHIDEILLKQDELRRVKHDMSNQLLAIQGYLKNGDYEGSEAYIKTLLKTIEGNTSGIKTGNSALDAILSTKKALAESKEIKCNMDVQIPRGLSMAPVDVCIIFGNALDNAIEACERIEDGEKKIQLFLIERENKLLCHLTNTTSLDSMKGVAKTSKSDQENHGFGLNNMREALAKYDSEPIIELKDGIFSLKFVVFEGA
ncbi:MAG: GHKL domain-containing protein [Peptococcaceae bacterium]